MQQVAKFTVTYIGDGDPKSTADAVTFRGVTFPASKPVNLDVTTKDGEAMIAKLKGNSHFTVVEADAPKKAKAE